MPPKEDLCNPSSERFISKDASSYVQVRLLKISTIILYFKICNYYNDIYPVYLQFLPRRATASQRTFYGVENCFVLATDKPNSRQNDLVIHPHALPIIMEWPSYDYYKVGGKYIPQPDLWGANFDATPVVVDFNFETKSPVKAFSPKFNHKREK